MSDPKITLLVLGAGCAAMVGVAAAVVSAGSFFSDLPTASAQASAYELPPRKVKTIAIVDKAAEKGPAVAIDSDRSSTASVRVAKVDDSDTLHGASPRWALNGASASGTQSQRDALVAAYADDAVESDPFSMMVTSEESLEPTLELAGTVPHVPEPAPREEAERKPSNDVEPAPKVATTGRALTGSTSLNEAANMRAAPRSGSKVLTVVPDGVRVSIAPGCEQWCEIAYNGQRGFVYKDFVGSGRVAAAKPRAKAEPTTANGETLDKAIYGDSNFITSGGQSTGSTDTDQKTASNTGATEKKPVHEPSMR